jgi:putative transcription regulator (tetR family)
MEQQDLLSNYRKDLKERILITSMRAFKERGIRSVRMDDIATTLGISKRTIYEIYSNKEELLLDGIMREDKARKLDSQLYAQDKSHTVMDLIFHIYNREMADMASTNPLFFSELSRDIQ